MTAPKAPEPQPATSSAAVPAQASPPATAPPATAPPAPPAAPAKAAPTPPPPARTPPPKAKAKQKSGDGMAGGAFVVAVCALLVAIGAIGVSIYSLRVARDAISKNPDRDAAAAAPASPAAATPESTVTRATPAPSTSTVRVQYISEFVRQEIKIPAPTGCNAAYVDVDTLELGKLSGHEFYVSACVEPLSVRVDRTSGASSSSSNPTPEACHALLAGTSTSQELVLPARSSLTFCLLTHKGDATTQNLPQRLAIVEVRDVAVDKTVTVAISTFRIV